MKKRIISCLLAVTLIASMVVGCGAKEETKAPAEESATEEVAEEETPQEPQEVTITVGNWPAKDHEKYEAREAQRAAFMEKYPYIKVETDEYQYATDSYLAKAAAGQLPDVYNTFFTEVDKIINAGYAADITTAYNNSNLAGKMEEDVLSLASKDGKIYGVPVSTYSMGLYVNVNLFKEAGLVDEEGIPVFPTTWEEVAEAAATIKEKTGKAGFGMPTTNNQGGWIFSNIFWGFGGEYETQVDGKWTATFDSAEGVAALQFIKDLKWKYNAMSDNAICDLNTWTEQFGTDQVAMGIVHLPYARTFGVLTGMSKDALGFTTIPAGPAGQASVTGGDVYMMAPETTVEQQEAVIKWIEFVGNSPVLDADSLASLESDYKSWNEKELPTGMMGLSIWGEEAERTAAEREIAEKYLNVDLKLWPYCENSGAGIKAEPPVNAQELYAALDSVLQEVLTNKDADCQALLSEAAKNFQSDYLDYAN